MNANRIISLLALLLTTGAYAQSADAAGAMPVPTAAPAVAAPTPAASKVIYAPRLPTANELSAAAAAQQLTIVRIEQTTSSVTAVYQSAAGAASTVVYQLLPGANTATPAVAAPSAPAPAVVYQPAARVAYYDGYGPYYYDPYYYDPYYWYPPVSVRLGFGYRGGFRR